MINVNEFTTGSLRSLYRAFKQDLATGLAPEAAALAKSIRKAIKAELALRDAEQAKREAAAARVTVGWDMLATKLSARVTDDDSTGSTWKLTAPHSLRKADRDYIREELRDQFDRRCYCEHDCCGHVFGGLSSLKRVRGHYIFTVGYARNV